MATRLPRLPPQFRPLGLRGQRVLVVGLGSFGGGLGAALHLAREGADVIVSDLRGADELREPMQALAELPPRYVLGRHPIEEVARVDWIVASPAVKWTAPPLLEAARLGVPVESEITLLLRLLPCPSLGITGTNGKSTTTMLAGRALAAARRTWTGGNLGGSLLDVWREIAPQDAAVLELSSFQLEHLEEVGLGPTVGLVTNVTPDHLDRHGTLAAYARAKQAILSRAQAAVLNRACPACRSFAAPFMDASRASGRRGEVLWFGEERELAPCDAGVFLRGDDRAVRRDAQGREVEVELPEMRLRGSHNRLNLIAAAAAATCFEVEFEAALRAGRDAQPLPQRMNEVARVGGVLFVDDSVSTSPPAVVAALESYGRGIRLLAGGYDKGIDQAPLVAAIRERCRKAYLYGAAAPALAAALERASAVARSGDGDARRADGGIGWEVHADLRRAFAAAAREASHGETVLFSPGFASYDQFRNFTERGDLFRDLVRSLQVGAARA